MVLNWKLRDVLAELRPEGRLNVLIALLLHANLRLRCWPSMDCLARETGYELASVTAAKRWLLEHRAIVLVPYPARVGEERQLPRRQHVYQLTGVLVSDGDLIAYLHLTPEAQDSVAAALAEVSPSEISVGEISLGETKVNTNIKDGYTSQDTVAAAAATEGDGEDPDGPPVEGSAIRYVADPFEREAGQRPKWALPDTRDLLVMAAFKACKRRYFKKGEKTRWKALRQGLVAGTIPQAWLEHCLEYAEKKPMPFDSLLRWMANTEKMSDWAQRHGGSRRTVGGVSASWRD